MFVQVIQGQVADAEQAHAALDRWARELAPGATGWLGRPPGERDGRSSPWPASSPRRPPAATAAAPSRTSGGPRRPSCSPASPPSRRAPTSSPTSSATPTPPASSRSCRARAPTPTGPASSCPRTRRRGRRSAPTSSAASPPPTTAAPTPWPSTSPPRKRPAKASARSHPPSSRPRWRRWTPSASGSPSSSTSSSPGSTRPCRKFALPGVGGPGHWCHVAPRAPSLRCRRSGPLAAAPDRGSSAPSSTAKRSEQPEQQQDPKKVP